MGIGQSALEGLGMTPQFWRGRRVFLTGHTGFKGSWLALWLSQLGAEVVGFAQPPLCDEQIFVCADVAAAISSSNYGDILDLTQIKAQIRRAQPEIVFHLAAQSLVRASYADPVATYATNVLGTAHVLEAIRSLDGVRAAIIVTSDKCYENREWDWGYRETDRLGGHDPYSNSKACAELVTACYRQSFFNDQAPHASRPVQIASVRAGNVIGGGDQAVDRLLPDLMRALASGRDPVIRNPEAIRPWQHVLEPLAGYLTLAEKLFNQTGYAQAWNFGPADEDARPVAWLVQQVRRLWQSDSSVAAASGGQPHEARLLKLDSSQAKARLQWRARLELAQALRWVVEWEKARLSKANMRQFTGDQITQYMALESQHA